MSTLEIFFLVIIPLGILLININSFLIILCHELSHAIPALIFTRKPVIMYIGSHGDNKGWKIRLKFLTIIIKPKLFYYRSGGLCRYEHVSSNIKSIIIISSGPLVTAILGVLFFYLISSYSIHGSLKLIISVFAIMSVISLIYSLIPKVFKSPNGQNYYTDGYQLKALTKSLKGNFNYETAELYIKQQKFDLAEKELTGLFNSGQIYNHILFSLIHCHVKLNKIEFANRNLDLILKDSAGWTADIYCTYAYYEILLKNFEKALHGINESLKLAPNHLAALNNRGYIYIIKEEYDLSILDLTRIIELDESFVYAYINRCQAYLKKGKTPEALSDIQKALELDKDNVYVQIQLSRYFMANNDFESAFKHLNNAKDIDNSIPEIEEEMNFLNVKTQTTLSSL